MTLTRAFSSASRDAISRITALVSPWRPLPPFFDCSTFPLLGVDRERASERCALHFPPGYTHSLSLSDRRRACLFLPATVRTTVQYAACSTSCPPCAQCSIRHLYSLVRQILTIRTRAAAAAGISMHGACCRPAGSSKNGLSLKGARKTCGRKKINFARKQ